MTTELVRARYLFREVNERGFDLPLGSVTKDGGVEFRSNLDIAVWNPGDDTSGYKRVLPGDFVIGLRSFQSGIGYSSIETIVSPAYTVLRPVSDRVHARYYRHLFKSDVFISRLENVAQGIRQGRTIATEDFYNLDCPVPPLAEQRAVADYLDAETARIDALIAKKQQLIHLLEERLAALLDARFSPSVSDPTVRLARLAIVQTGITLNAAKVSTTETVRMPYLRVANVQPGRLDLSEVKEVEVDRVAAARSRLCVGDVLMTEGGDIDKLGRGTVWRGEIEHCLHQNHVFAVRPRPGQLDSDFLANVTRTSHARAYFESTGVQSTNLASTNSFKVADFRVPALDLATQRARCASYERSAQPLSGSLQKLREQLDLLAEHRQALITVAVTGDLTIPGGQRS